MTNSKAYVIMGMPTFQNIPRWIRITALTVFLTAVAWGATLRIDKTPPLSTPPFIADSIVVFKEERELCVFDGDTVARSYQVSLGKSYGRKEREGDHRTPEGHYIIDWRNPHSKYHLSLHISYPNQFDSLHADSLHLSPSGDIMIHGLPHWLGFVDIWHLNADWTNGCIAVTNGEIEELWQIVPEGCPVAIYAGRE